MDAMVTRALYVDASYLTLLLLRKLLIHSKKLSATLYFLYMLILYGLAFYPSLFAGPLGPIP
jgi:hypothetical protein